jgi:protein-L-isoaspartate O-methyltransferase
VLDVGCGSGYLCAAFAELVSEEGGHVTGIDNVPELVERSGENLRKSYSALLDNHTIELHGT